MDHSLTERQRIKHRTIRDFRDIKLEKKFVGGVLQSLEAFARVVEEFKRDALTGEKISKIYELAVQVFHESNGLLTEDSLANLLNVRQSTKESFLRLFRQCIERGEKQTLSDIITSKDRLMRLYNCRIMHIGISDAIGDLARAAEGDLEQVDLAVNKIGEIHNDITARKVATIVSNPFQEYPSWKRRFKDIQEHPELIRSIPTGIPAIDRCMLGIRDGELGVLIAPTGVGKSIGLMNIGVHCWRTVGTAVIFTIEMPAEQYTNRLYSYLARIPYDRFREYSLDKDDWKRIDRVVKRGKKQGNELIIVDMPEGCTAEGIKSELRLIRRKHDVRLVGVDYMNIMGNTTGINGFDWEFQVQTAMELKLNLCRSMALPVWTVAQSTGEAEMAFARHIKDQIDVGVIFTPTEDHAETEMLKMDWCKTRDFKGISTVCHTDRAHMCFIKKKQRSNKPEKRLSRKQNRRLKV
jgi:replicative DNA helicase